MPWEWKPGIGADAEKFRRLLRKHDYEVLGIFDRDGTPIHTPVTEEDENTVPIPAAWKDDLAGSTLIHNHPGGGIPSVPDLDVLQRYALRRIEIVTRHGVFGLTAEPPWTEDDLRRAVSVRSAVRSRRRNRPLNPALLGEEESRLLDGALLAEGFAVNYTPWKSSTS